MEDPAQRSLRNHRFFSKVLDMIDAHPYYDEVPAVHAAVLVRGGKILSRATNAPRRNGFVDHFAHHDGCNLHAEAALILKMRRKMDLRGCKIFVARMRKDNGMVGMSRPCPSCQAIIKSYGIDKVYYSNECGQISCMKRSEL